MDYQILCVGPEAAEIIYRTVRRSWVYHYSQFMNRRDLAPFMGYRLRRYERNLLLLPGSKGYLIRVDSTYVAVMVLVRNPVHYEIEELFVTPGYTSRGLGKTLLDAARVVARNNHKRLELGAMRNNMRARLFYEREGGRLVAVGKWEWGAGWYPTVRYRWNHP